MPRPRIYLDHHATTPVDPRVVEAMLPYFSDRFGNAGSRSHGYGWEAADAVDRARRQVAALVGAPARTLVFTSGATEANNLAIKGVAAHLSGERDHIITVATEHRAVLDPCAALSRRGWRVTVLPVGTDGRVDPDAVRDAIEPRTALVSVMAANNEIGVLHPLRDVVRAAHERGLLVHTDATQAAGKIPFDVDALDVDLASFSAHKMYGPKGIGALYVRRRRPPIELEPLIDGGGHERGLRSGTLNVPAIVGFGRAAEICQAVLSEEPARLEQLRDRMLQHLDAAIPGLRVNGSLEHRLPHNLNVSVEDVDGEELMLALGDVALSSGAACASANREPSHVLRAIGVPDELSRASIRVGLGRWNTLEEVDYVVERLASAIPRLREMARASRPSRAS